MGSQKTLKQLRFEQMRQESSRAIRLAALELFAAKGFKNTSMEEIARKAKVSKGLIYNYFDSKQDLIEALIEEGLKRLRHLECTVYQQEMAPQVLLKHFVHAIFDAIRQEPFYWKLYTMLLFKGEVFVSAKEKALAFAAESLNRIEAIFKALEVPNPQLEARLLVAAIDGLLLHYFFDMENYPLEEMQQQLLVRFSKCD